MTCDSGLDMAGIGMGVMMMGRRRVDDRRGSRRNARRDNPGSAHGERGQGRNGKSDSPEQGKHRHPTKLWPRPGNHTVEQESLQYGDARRDGLARTPRQSHAKRVAPPDGLRDGELGHHSHSAAHRLKQDLLARRNFRRARRARPVELGGRLIEIVTSSRAFLHNQVRSMAGSLKLVGEGKWTADDLRAALEAKDRKACGPVAPACGLYFERVEY